MIEEMNRPLEGLMKISGAPLRNALTHLGQWMLTADSLQCRIDVISSDWTIETLNSPVAQVSEGQF